MSTMTMDRPRSARMVATVVAGLGCALLLGSGNAFAQAAVVDLPHTIKTALGWVAQYEQMIEQYKGEIEQLQTLNKQYEQAFVRGEVYRGDPGHRERFLPRDPDAGVGERCTMKADSGPAAEQQLANCGAIVRMENRRFNAMVAMLEDVGQRDEELREAYAERAGIGEDEQGKLESNTNRILSIQSQLQNDVQNAGALMDAYDAALRSLHEDQVRAANAALKPPHPAAGVVQGAALRVALRAARSRER